MAPDTDFLKFFNGDWQELLRRVIIPGTADASWDRKAAWLLWRYGRECMDEYGEPGIDELLGGTKPPGPLARLAHDGVLRDPVASYKHSEHAYFVNRAQPEGVPLVFDADKVMARPIVGKVEWPR